MTMCGTHGCVVPPNMPNFEGYQCCTMGRLEIIAERLCASVMEMQEYLRKQGDAAPVSESSAGEIIGKLNALSAQVVCVQQTLNAHGSQLNEHEEELTELNAPMEFE